MIAHPQTLEKITIATIKDLGQYPETQAKIGTPNTGPDLAMPCEGPRL
jgi:hypothetical protein